MRWKISRRDIRFWWQRRWRGWDGSELFSLDYTILKFTLPRLKEFAAIQPDGGFLALTEHGFEALSDLPPLERQRIYKEADERWQAYLSEMVRAMEVIVNNGGGILGAANAKNSEYGMSLFHKYFNHPWY